eukprot:TRINITY_DN346_c2_g1_i1.p1 TRINITY_DN346_c2_g1~~TRINITY_DN346_c2_g1_i1.p1  ORF type:complete len:199 (-),score=-2.20 TRINITY_DN346_c2_g1_i1:22-618(-)
MHKRVENENNESKYIWKFQSRKKKMSLINRYPTNFTLKYSLNYLKYYCFFSNISTQFNAIKQFVPNHAKQTKQKVIFGHVPQMSLQKKKVKQQQEKKQSLKISHKKCRLFPRQQESTLVTNLGDNKRLFEAVTQPRLSYNRVSFQSAKRKKLPSFLFKFFIKSTRPTFQPRQLITNNGRKIHAYSVKSREFTRILEFY